MYILVNHTRRQMVFLEPSEIWETIMRLLDTWDKSDIVDVLHESEDFGLLRGFAREGYAHTLGKDVFGL